MVVQMQMEKIGLWEFLFHCKVPGIDDKKCEYRQRNQIVEYIFLEYKLFACQQGNLWTEKAKKVQKEKGKSLNIELILIDSPCTKKVAIFIKKTGLTDRSMAPTIEDN